MPTPCKTPGQSCPKVSPEEAHKYELSAQNLRALSLYFSVRASGGAVLPDRLRFDPVFRRNIAIIDRIVREHEAASLTNNLSVSIELALRRILT